jgi:hypothetical protein
MTDDDRDLVIVALADSEAAFREENRDLREANRQLVAFVDHLAAENAMLKTDREQRDQVDEDQP